MSAISADIHSASSVASTQPWYVRHAAHIGYGICAVALWLGWLLTRQTDLVNPEEGLGYWLGIVGASLMAILLLYPLRKRIRFFRHLGATRHWFRAHMIFGVVGPVLILYHSNFGFGSMNSNVALVCTLLVAGSGLAGRYLYKKIHTDLDGHKASLQELTSQAGFQQDGGSAVSKLLPELSVQITAFDELVLKPPGSLLLMLVLPLKLAVETRWLSLRLMWFARRELGHRARESAAVASQRRRLQGVVNRFILEHMSRVRRVAEFSSYERLFSLWHIFHLPFFYMLVVTALLHVLAVHMY